MSDVIVAPETRDLGDLARSLAKWMGGKMPGASDVRIDNLTYPRGAGQSHETILFDAHWARSGRRAVLCASSREASPCSSILCSTSSSA